MRTLTFTLSIFVGLTTFAQIHSDSSQTNVPKIPFARHAFSMEGLMNYPYLYLHEMHGRDLYKNNLDWGARLSYIFSTSSRFGFGLEYGVDFSKVDLNTSYTSTITSLISQDYLSIDHEGMDIVVQTLMPKVEWKTRHDTGTDGFYHQLGVGITLCHVREKNYRYELLYEDVEGNEYATNAPNDAEESFNDSQLYDYTNKPYWGASVMYALVYRRKFSESLLWSLGLRTQVNINESTYSKVDFSSDEEDTNYWITRREMREIIALCSFRSIFHLQFGLVYRL